MCGQKVVANESFLGKKVPCPTCEGFVEFPSAEMLAEKPELILGEESSLASAEAASPEVSADEVVGSADSPEQIADLPRAEIPQSEGDVDYISGAYEDFAGEDALQENGLGMPADADSGGYGAFLSGEGQAERDEDEDGAEAANLPSPAWGAASFTFALGAWITVIGGVLLAPMAIVAGHLGCHRYRESPIQPAPGHSLAALGMVFGYAQVVFLMILLGALVLFREPIGQLAEGLLKLAV